jgi:hypothetical protein
MSTAPITLESGLSRCREASARMTAILDNHNRVVPGLAKALAWLKNGRQGLANGLSELRSTAAGDALVDPAQRTVDHVDCLIRAVEAALSESTKP